MQYLAEALYKKGHEVTVYCKIARDVDMVKYPWMQGAVNIDSENACIQHAGALGDSVVHDWTHMKPLRLARIPKYLSTVMWTDAPGIRNVFPSRAVATAFGKPGAPVIPLGLPVDTFPGTADAGDYYLCSSRMADYKGVDIAIDIARRFNIKLVVAGHAGVFADKYYAMKMKKECTDLGIRYIEDPPDAEIMALMRSAKGLIHMHRWLESFSLAAAQALCLGIPVLTSNVGGPQEYVAGTGGGVVSPLPPDPGADGVISGFLGNHYDGQAKADIATKARSLFDINRIADVYCDIYGGL